MTDKPGTYRWRANDRNYSVTVVRENGRLIARTDHDTAWDTLDYDWGGTWLPNAKPSRRPSNQEKP